MYCLSCDLGLFLQTLSVQRRAGVCHGSCQWLSMLAAVIKWRKWVRGSLASQSSLAGTSSDNPRVSTLKVGERPTRSAPPASTQSIPCIQPSQFLTQTSLPATHNKEYQSPYPVLQKNHGPKFTNGDCTFQPKSFAPRSQDCEMDC